jgi:negative regulator of genetic competence, sporulation and motility
MDGNIQKALWIGVSILLFVAVVAIGMAAYGKAAQMSDESMDNLDKQSQQLSNSAYGVYDNQYVSGTDVVNAIKNYKATPDEMQIIVVKGGASTYYLSTGTATSGTLSPIAETTTNTMLKSAQDKNNASAYINSYGEFYATVITDVNGSVRAIRFEQQ